MKESDSRVKHEQNWVGGCTISMGLGGVGLVARGEEARRHCGLVAREGRIRKQSKGAATR